MRPYLAIIVDAFREALASRVLWVLVIGITLVLLALAPLGYRTELTTEFLSNNDFYSPRELAGKLRRGRLPVDTPAHAIWRQLDESQRTTIRELGELQGDNLLRQVGGLRRCLNEVIESEGLYDEQKWSGTRILPEAQELLQRRDDLDEQQRQRLNRLLIESAYPEHIRLRPGETVTITYALLSFPRTWLDEVRLRKVIEELVLPLVMNFLLGVIAVLIALLVTSPVIPEMFAAGSLHLLLSKPLSRSLMFLSRFLGGCFFILINAIYLLVGLWLVAGLRFGLWSDGLLKCIPLFMFLFMVYYSVSALAGAYWKNAIVAVGVAVGLWGLCFLLGVAKGWMEDGARRASLRRLVLAGDSLIGVSENNEVAAWSGEDNQWQEVFEGGPVFHGPLYLSDLKMIVATSGARGRALRFVQRERTLTLSIGKAADGWTRQSRGSAPDRTAALLRTPDQQLLAVAAGGIYRRTGKLGERSGGLLGLGNLPIERLSLPFLGDGWTRVGGPDPDGQPWQNPLEAAIGDDGDVIVYHRGRVLRFQPPNEADPQDGSGMYELAAETHLEVRPQDGAAICCAGDRVVVAVADGRVLLLQRGSLKLLAEQRPSRFSQPRQVAASPDGRTYAVLLQNGRVYLARDDEPLRRIAAPRTTTVTLTDGTLLAASLNRNVTELTWDGEVVRTIRPPLENLQRIYFGVVNPLSMILPMPGELGETSRYLISGKQTTDLGLFEGSLDAPYEQLDPWTPVIRCSVFIAVMLLLGCWYIERQEF